MKKFILLMMGLSVLSLAGMGQAAVYDIDASHSHVGFRIRHLVSKVPGSFGEFSGTINFDEKKPKSLETSATIKTASVDTNNEKRDAHLRSEDFFNAEKYPEITFVSKKAKVGKDGTIELTGDLTMLGVTKPITLDVEVGGVGPDPWGNTRVGLSARGKLDRKDFGMVYNIAIDKGGVVLGDEVEIILDVEGIQRKDK